MSFNRRNKAMDRNKNRSSAALVALSMIVPAAACDSRSSTSPSSDQNAASSTTSQSSGSTAPSDGRTAVGQPRFRAEPECGTYDGTGCAPESNRVDIDPPTFSNPKEITNPLFPISMLKSAVLLGVVDDQPFRSETTLLPNFGLVIIDGEPVEVLLSQYTAYLDGRITEVAVDRYAQADDGSVWYLGEDVYDYQNGTITVSEGTWLAGRDGPPAMIMAADPEVGQVFRPEDIPGIVFEEVTIQEVGKTVDGPFGKVEGAIVAEELHLDGSTSEKMFAPGYGEFYSAHEGDEEALSLAVPTDGQSAPEPVELAKLITGTWGLVESARLEDWEAVDSSLERIKDNWDTLSAAATPARVAGTLDAALVALTEAAVTRDPTQVNSAAVDVAQYAIDLELRYRPVALVDIGRFHLHAQQLRIDAAAADPSGVAAEVATLEWIRDRITATLTIEELRRVDEKLSQLRTAVNTGNLSGAADQAARLANLVRTLSLP
jgi:hypothetical protein